MAELCFYAPAAQRAGRMMRVTGKVEFLDDKSLEERLFLDRPWVKDLMNAVPKNAQLALFRMSMVTHTSGPLKTTCGSVKRPS
jgi:uncharacterized pyridoxamine 5'-phosphate oxidase family protein